MRKDTNHWPEMDKKWQEEWERAGLFHRQIDLQKPKLYILDMFPYPSANGLHVGHPEGYTASDILSRYYTMRGYHVLHPMGWDAFGLPTENYAIKMKIHPQKATDDNVDNFRRQIKRFGFSYDWTREVNTTDPEYYKWTQWIFLKLLEKGLAYEAKVPINWCPDCKTGLANEEVSDGLCERCGAVIERRSMRQWMLRITQYADRLLSGLDELDWPEKIKTMQRNWIGKSLGALINFPVVGSDKSVQVFTTRPDTLFGATYMVLAPEHPLLDELAPKQNKEKIREYRDLIKAKSDLERTSLSKEKTGVETGLFAINPATQDKIPIYISDYVLMHYGTGAVMAVAAHDQRDYEFATKFHLPIHTVIEPFQGPWTEDRAFEEVGKMIHSGQFNGLKSSDAIPRIIDWLEEQKIGEKSVQYKLRDWVFSRQRFWGEPIPVVHCEHCGIVPVPVEQLPLTLPEIPFYETSGTGESPLATIHAWVNTQCPKCGGPAKRETNTMPQWAGSCWYYIRYIDPHNNTRLASEEAIRYWLPVDLYIGGAEHAVLHLMYARFWHKFLFDLGMVNHEEPFLQLRNQGMVLAEDGRKMSKSLGNVINPDDVLNEYGADVVRMYEMFMGPFEQESLWSTQGIEGVHRFLGKVESLFELPKNTASPDPEALKKMHQAIKKVTLDVESMNFNTAISAMMIWVNTLQKMPVIPVACLEILLKILSPFAPHLTEELWHRLGHHSFLYYETWPMYEESLTKENMIEIPVQINGKLRDKIIVPPGLAEESIKEIVLKCEKIQQCLEGTLIKKWIIIPDRTINIVV